MSDQILLQAKTILLKRKSRAFLYCILHFFPNLAVITRGKKHLNEKGAQKVIIGCTDIRVGYYNEENLDSLSLLAELIIKERNDNEQ